MHIPKGMARPGRWRIDADISTFFDTLDHTVLREFPSQRVGDGATRRLIGNSSKTVMETGHFTGQNHTFS